MRWWLGMSLVLCLLILSACSAPEPLPPTLTGAATALLTTPPTIHAASTPTLSMQAASQAESTLTSLPDSASPEALATTLATATTRPRTETPSQTPAVEADGPLMHLYRHGGLCVTGSECQWQMVIYPSGAYTIGNEVGPVAEGVLSAEQVDELRRLIDGTDFEAVRSVPFTELCPTAYDGQESIYTFSTSHGEEEISSCEVQIDMSLPLFAWIEALIAELSG